MQNLNNFEPKNPGCMCYNLDNLGVDVEVCVTVWTIVVKVSWRTIVIQDLLAQWFIVLKV